jgi:hypothetical protein
VHSGDGGAGGQGRVQAQLPELVVPAREHLA